MAINDWWSADPEQRFWMEITDREDLGADLFAPTTNGSGKPYWGYELVTYVRPGDVVLHWHKTLAGEPGIVGWSVATGVAEDTDIAWQAHGSVGRATGTLEPRPAWRMPLMSYVPLPTPVLISDVRAAGNALAAVQAELEQTYSGALYFPFGFSDKRALRAQQTYLVKMPRQVLPVLGLNDLTGVVSTPTSTGEPAARSKSAGDSGYIADAAVRSAIEWRAVKLAVEAYEELGYEVEYTGSTQPYDLVVARGTDERRVEVKGSSGAARSVEFTHGEVDNSRAYSPTDLYVVDGITWWREADGSVQADGGEIRWWSDWSASDTGLTAIRFRYTLPGGDRPLR